MDQSRSIVLAAGAVSLAASLFAIGAAVSSDDGGGSAEPVATTEVVSSAPAGTDTETTAAPGAAEAPAGEQVAVAIAGFDFNGGEPLTVAVGTEVVWTNEDSMDHSVEFTAGTGIPTSPDLGEGDTYSFTFTEPGTYQYICGIHPQMRGTIVVEA